MGPNPFTSRQTDKLRVAGADSHGSNDLAWFHSGDTGAEPIHDANKIPSWPKGRRGRLGTNALAHQQAGQGDTCEQHSQLVCIGKTWADEWEVQDLRPMYRNIH